MSNGEYKIVLGDEVIAQGSINDVIDATKRFEEQIKQFDYVEKTIYSLLGEHNFNSYREYIDFAIKIRNLPTSERAKLVTKEVAINKYQWAKKKMKVIFRITKDLDKEDRIEYAKRIRDIWYNTKDLDCMVCLGSDVEVYVVNSDSELEIVGEENDQY